MNWKPDKQIISRPFQGIGIKDTVLLQYNYSYEYSFISWIKLPDPLNNHVVAVWRIKKLKPEIR